jgi:hypothetical protein
VGQEFGPATAFLYSGPAINVLAIVLTARILGWQLGLARAIGAVLFAVVVGLLMAFFFRKDDAARTAGKMYLPDSEEKGRTLTQDALFMLTMVLILVFAAFAKPAPGDSGIWSFIFASKWYVTAALLIILSFMLKGWFQKEERATWVQATWGFMKQIFPLLGAASWLPVSCWEDRAMRPSSPSTISKPLWAGIPCGPICSPPWQGH